MRIREKERPICILAGAVFLSGLVLWFVPGVKFSAYLCFGLAGLCILWLLLCRWAECSRFGKCCKWAFAAGVAAMTIVLCGLEFLIVRYGEAEHANQRADAVIVLGAGVNGTTPSLVLQSRIDAAARYLTRYPQAPAVLSGGQGPGEDITQAQAMYTALVEQGITPERLILEEQSTNTRQNLYYSKALLAQHGVDTYRGSVAIVTSDFHLFRAMMIEWDSPMTEVAVPAELPWWRLNANYYVREAFAIVKEIAFKFL